MTWSNNHALFDGETPVEDTASAVVNPQRTRDETGVWQIEVNQDPNPGGGSTGRIALEGRLTADLSWTQLKTQDLSTFDGASSYPYSVLVEDVPVLAHMRSVFRDTVSVAGGTEVTDIVQD